MADASPTAAVGDEELQIKLMLRRGIHHVSHHDHCYPTSAADRFHTHYRPLISISAPSARPGIGRISGEVFLCSRELAIRAARIEPLRFLSTCLSRNGACIYNLSLMNARSLECRRKG